MNVQSIQLEQKLFHYFLRPGQNRHLHHDLGDVLFCQGNAVQGVASQPRFLMEHIATVVREENAYQIDDPYSGSAADRIEMFRITARGVGGTQNTRVLLQSTYGRILD